MLTKMLKEFPMGNYQSSEVQRKANSECNTHVEGVRKEKKGKKEDKTSKKEGRRGEALHTAVEDSMTLTHWTTTVPPKMICHSHKLPRRNLKD